MLLSFCTLNLHPKWVWILLILASFVSPCRKIPSWSVWDTLDSVMVKTCTLISPSQGCLLDRKGVWCFCRIRLDISIDYHIELAWCNQFVQSILFQRYTEGKQLNFLTGISYKFIVQYFCTFFSSSEPNAEVSFSDRKNVHCLLFSL